MEFASLDNMRRCIKHHVLANERLASRSLRILDVGGGVGEGSYRSLFVMPGWTYVRAVLGGDPSSDVVLDDLDHLPFDDDSFDVVVSGNTFEHHPGYLRLFAEMVRVCSNDGVLFVLAPSAGEQPPAGAGDRPAADRYRFLPDAFQALADANGLDLADHWRDDRGPRHELVGVFERTDADTAATSDRTDSSPSPDEALYVPEVDGALQNAIPAEEVPEHEVGQGTKPTAAFLKAIHQVLEPRFYLEIGVEYGTSLAFAAGPGIGIDPAPQLRKPLADRHEVYEGLSQDFFVSEEATSRLGPLDLAYVDGMHLLENALLDFMYVERHAHPASVLLVDDIYPNHPQQALRNRSSRHWTGDVWKIIDILRLVRPDLILLPINTFPSGTLMVLGSDPDNQELWRGFGTILAEAAERSEVPGPDILERHDALDPADPLIERVLGMLRDARTGEPADVADALDRVRRVIAGAVPRELAPR